MNEIEKMYENAGIGKRMTCFFECSRETCSVNCEHFEKLDMSFPLFTAEKQIELIKWFVTNNAELETLEITYYSNDCFQISSCTKTSHFETNFDDALAGLINNIWQDLTEEEKQQIREILE